jgi:glycosyltransferase involved in cell wall biosynthesis
MAAAWHRPHLLHVFPTFAVGGVQVRMSDVINHFGPKFRHTIVAMDGATDCMERLRSDLDLKLLALPAEAKTGGPFGRFLLFHRLLRAIRPELLLTYNWGAIEWALVARFSPICRHIHLESGFGSEEADSQLRRRVWVRRLALGRAERIVVPSRNLADIVVRNWRLSPKKVLYIPNGVDCTKFAAPPETGIIPGVRKRPGELIVGTIAPLRREKNIARLIRAFAGLSERFDARLLIVGSGPEQAPLVALAETAAVADKVLFANQIGVPEKVIGWIDVYAISSDTEQMPNTVLQAMAASRPIVGTDVGDVKLIVSPSNRPFIVARGDEASFEAALVRLLRDEALRASLGRENQDHVRANYSQEQMFRAYAALLEGQVGEAAGPQARLATGQLGGP